MTDYNPDEVADVSVGVGTLNAEPDRDIYRINVAVQETQKLVSVSGIFTTPFSPGFHWLDVTHAWGCPLTLESFRVDGVEQMAGKPGCGVLLTPRLPGREPIAVDFGMKPGDGFTLRLRVLGDSLGHPAGHGVRMEWIAPKAPANSWTR